jgi:hypothetical protein
VFLLHPDVDILSELAAALYLLPTTVLCPWLTVSGDRQPKDKGKHGMPVNVRSAGRGWRR